MKGLENHTVVISAMGDLNGAEILGERAQLMQGAAQICGRKVEESRQAGGSGGP